MATKRATAQERTGVRWTDVAWFTFFGVYTLGALAVLVQGLGSVVAYVSPDFHVELHVRGFGDGFVARTALRMAEGSHPIDSGLQVVIDYAFSLVNLALAGFLIWLRPKDRTARLLALGLVGTAGVFNLTAQRTLEVLPLHSYESTAQVLAHITAGISYVAALILFPDGRPIPRWKTGALVAFYVPLAVGAMALTLMAQGTARPAALIVFFGFVIPTAGVLAQAYRFRRSPTAEAHQQARLLFLALLPAFILGLGFVLNVGIRSLLVTELAGRHLPELPVVAFRIFQPVFMLIPAALFAGILRYRLWDIDRIINRTIVYAAVTALLAGGYFGIVVLLQRLLQPLTRESDLAVAVSTLFVAGAFRPALHRVQAFVDRRFYRGRYDAARTIEGFSARLRDQVDLDSLTEELREVVERTMRPAHVSLWVRETTNGHRAHAEVPVTVSVTDPGRRPGTKEGT